MLLNPDSLNENAGDIALSPEADAVLMAIAENMGLLVNEEEAAALTAFAETNLTEAQTIVRLNRNDKLAGLQARAALVIAQQRKDPLFARYAKVAEAKRRLRELIYKKYGTQAASKARTLLANAGKRNLVDIGQKVSSFSNPATRG